MVAERLARLFMNFVAEIAESAARTGTNAPRPTKLYRHTARWAMRIRPRPGGAIHDFSRWLMNNPGCPPGRGHSIFAGKSFRSSFRSERARDGRCQASRPRVLLTLSLSVGVAADVNSQDHHNAFCRFYAIEQAKSPDPISPRIRGVSSELKGIQVISGPMRRRTK